MSFSAKRMFLSLTPIVLEELRKPPDSRSSPGGGVPNVASLLLEVGIHPGRAERLGMHGEPSRWGSVVEHNHRI